MDILPDGTVIPSRFEVEETRAFDSTTHFDNNKLRFGEVQEIIYPDDKRSFSKKFIEYNVLVQHRSRGTASARLYSNCTLINHLAGLADKVSWTLRPEKHQGKQVLGKGSKVLVFCINGETNNGVILGGIRDSQDETDTKKGHNFHFVFNGVDVEINNAGELIVTRGGVTDHSGKTTEPASSRGQVKFFSNGSIIMQTGDQSVFLDAASKSVQVRGASEVDVEASTGNINVTAETGTVTVKASGVLLEAAGSIGIAPGGGPTGPLVLGNQANSPTLRGGPYRNAQRDFDSQLQSAFQLAATALATAAISLGSTDLATASAAMATAAAAVSSFEGRSGDFLSDKIFTE